MKHDIADPAVCLERIQNTPEALLGKIDAVDAKSRHRAGPAKADHSRDQFGSQMAESEGSGTDDRGIICRDMAVIGGKVGLHEAAIVTLLTRLVDHVGRDIDAVDHSARLGFSNGCRHQTGTATDIEYGSLRALLAGQHRGDGKRVDIAEAGCIGRVVEFGEIPIEIDVGVRRAKAVCAVQEADTFVWIITIHRRLLLSPDVA